MTARRRRRRAGRQRRGVSERTQARSVRAGRPRAAPDRPSPAWLRAEARRHDGLDVQQVTPASRRARPIARCGLP